MINRRCFVQFPHNGEEHAPTEDAHIDWNPNLDGFDHRRKFMEFTGSWIEEDSQVRSGDLWAWGEWEPESRQLDFGKTQSDSEEHAPNFLWQPYWNQPIDYAGLHNTDPYIFGDTFLYSNCRQNGPRGKSLRHLAEGSVIAFGSGKTIHGERKWVLDTVFVVRKYVDYVPSKLSDPVEMERLGLSETFAAVTGNMLPGLGDEQFRLYFGATQEKCVDGMFSFFPALPASKNRRFARPDINTAGTDFLNPRNWQGLKGASTDRTAQEIKDQWKLLKKEVFEAGLVLGVHAEEPKRAN